MDTPAKLNDFIIAATEGKSTISRLAARQCNEIHQLVKRSFGQSAVSVFHVDGVCFLEVKASRKTWRKLASEIKNSIEIRCELWILLVRDGVVLEVDHFQMKPKSSGNQSQ